VSLRDLNTRARRRLRLHGWLLTIWCVAVGGLANWLLLRRFGIVEPPIRYAISAIAMYALGLVLGARYWLRHFSALVNEDAQLGEAATAEERAAFDGRRSRLREASRESFDWGDVLGSAADMLSFDEASLLLLIPALALLALGVVLMLGMLPVVLVDGLAALLAEVAVQFVFGALIARRVLRPRSHDDAFLHIVGKTWFIGVALVLLSAAAGWGLQQLQPGAVSIGDLFR
jgi:hypothetical protein